MRYMTICVENNEHKHTRRYTPEEDAYLKANVDRVTQGEMAEHLGRSVSSVNLRIVRMRRSGLIGEPKRPWKSMTRWTKEKDEWLIEHAATMSLKELAESLGLKPTTISCHLSDLRNKGLYTGRKRYIRPKTESCKSNASNSPSPTEMLCWYCRKATNPPGNDCPWSGALRPVSGWSVTEREIPIKMKKTGETTMRTVHNVTKCPLFEEE